MTFRNIIYEKKEAIGYLTLNRPDRLNAMNAALLAEFREALDAVEDDPGRASGYPHWRGAGLLPPVSTSAGNPAIQTLRTCSPTSGGAT